MHFLPRYTLDLNAIVNASSKLKTFSRKATAQASDGRGVMPGASAIFRSQDCANDFKQNRSPTNQRPLDPFNSRQFEPRIGQRHHHRRARLVG